LLGLTLSLPIQKSTIKITSLSIQKSAANYVAADSEIGNQKLCRCRFRNRQPFVPLSAAKNCVAADSEIGTQKLFRYRFRNRQQNCVVAYLKISTQKQCRC
jgi:hypothetical protein